MKNRRSGGQFVLRCGRLECFKSCLYEALARSCRFHAARLIDMAMEKECRQAERRAEAVDISRAVFLTVQEWWQEQHLVRPGSTRSPADRPARLRRHISKVGTTARRGALGQIETKAEVVQNGKLETDEELTGIRRIVEIVEDDFERF